MGHSKETMLEEMRSKGGAMMATLIEEDAKIKPDHLSIPSEAIDYRADFIRPAYHWLNTVYDSEYAEVRRIKKMQPPEMWLRYKKWGGFEDHQEVLLLNKALVDLRAKLVGRDRPDFYKKSKRNVKKNKTKASTENTAASQSESEATSQG